MNFMDKKYFKKNNLIIFGTLFILITTSLASYFLFFAGFDCGKAVLDIEGNEYETVEIGNQCWFAENLKTTKYRNGEPILEAANHTHADDSWYTREPVYTWYNYWDFRDKEKEYVEKYGYLYNWYVVNKRNTEGDEDYSLCPEGWKVPSHEEWTELERFICEDMGNPDCEQYFPYDEKEEGYQGKDEGVALKSKEAAEENSSADKYGFSAIFGGIRYPNGAFHSRLEIHTGWWSSTGDEGYAWVRTLHATDSRIGRYFNDKGHAYPVRCLKK